MDTVLELHAERAKNRALERQIQSIIGSARTPTGVAGVSSECSVLQGIRRTEMPMLPSVLSNPCAVTAVAHEPLSATDEDVKSKFPCTFGGKRVSIELDPTCGSEASSRPMRIGLVLSGGQAPGGHNVIAGVYDCIKKVSPESVLIGFTDGPQGIYNNKYITIDDARMDLYRNMGGFDMLGSGRHKIEKPEEFSASMTNCQNLKLDGLIVIGGDDSNTNAAVLAEYFAANNCNTKVAGCPKTIDGDLKVSPYIPISFGFDSATRTFSEFIGNLASDTLSTQKYWHFVRLMGRDASNIALECALQTRPNVCLISEEVEHKAMSMQQISQYVANIIVSRSTNSGKNYGIVLLPEGLIEFIPEFEVLIAQINDVLATGVETTIEAVYPKLTPENQVSFNYLPISIKQQILLERDPHGNVQVAKIETERLLAQTVEAELAALKAAGKYNGTFFPQFHSFGYEGRSGLPSPFDATYCYSLGYNAGCIIKLGLSGLMSSVTGLDSDVANWQCGGVPITSMCRMEKRHGKLKPVIKKNLVELDQTPFKVFAAQREAWATYDLYRSPGPMQFFSGALAVELCITLTLELKGSDVRVDAASTASLLELQRTSSRRCGDILSVVMTEAAAKAAFSENQRLRLAYSPALCSVFSSGKVAPMVVKTEETQCRKQLDVEAIRRAFPRTYGSKLVRLEPHGTNAPHLNSLPMRVGVVVSGRQSPGAHDVIAALVDSLAARGDGSSLIGFIGGTHGLFKNHTTPLTPEKIAYYRGQAGVELLARTEDTIKPINYGDLINSCKANGIEHLVILGGSRSVSQAAYLSEYLLSTECNIQVVCVPVDASGSLKNDLIETNVGFDTVTKTAAQIVGNNATDGASAKKYYYFIRLMGQEYSHVCMEVALQTKPNFAILLEEVEQKSMSLLDITRAIADVIEARAAVGKNYGTVLVPDGLIDAIPEFKFLISELDALYLSNPRNMFSMAAMKASMTHWSRTILERLPEFMQVALFLGRGSDGKINVSQIETEKLLAHFVEIELGYRKKRGEYKGSFSAVCSFVGYQARGSLPSNFDVNYGYNLGRTAAALLSSGECSGYVACIHNLKEPVSQWTPGAIPLCALLECKSPGAEAQIPRARVDLSSPAYESFASSLKTSAVQDRYENPGPIQFQGPDSITNSVPYTLAISKGDYLADVKAVHSTIDKIANSCRYVFVGWVVGGGWWVGESIALSISYIASDFLTLLSSPPGTTPNELFTQTRLRPEHAAHCSSSPRGCDAHGPPARGAAPHEPLSCVGEGGRGAGSNRLCFDTEKK